MQEQAQSQAQGILSPVPDPGVNRHSFQRKERRICPVVEFRPQNTRYTSLGLSLPHMLLENDYGISSIRHQSHGEITVSRCIYNALQRTSPDEERPKTVAGTVSSTGLLPSNSGKGESCCRTLQQPSALGTMQGGVACSEFVA